MNNNKILETIFGSKAKARVIKLFLHRRNLSLTAEDISKRIGVRGKECLKAVSELLRVGFLLKAKQDNPKSVKRRR